MSSSPIPQVPLTGTAAELANFVLAKGQLAHETDTGSFKVGDGVTRHGSLSVAMDAALSGAFPSVWAASTAYLAGQSVISPVDGSVVQALAAHTSGTVFNAANWTQPVAVGNRLRSLTAGLPQVTDRSNSFSYNSLSNGTDTSGNYRFAHIVITPCHDIRLLFSNYYVGSTDGPNNITVKVTVEAPVNASQNSTTATSVYPVTFQGASSVTIAPAGFALSDPIPLSAVAGQYIYTRTYVSVSSAGLRWPLGAYIGGLPTSRQEGFITGAPATDRTAAGTTISGGFGPSYGPMLVVGVPSKGASEPKTLLGIGDSIMFGSGDSYHDLGYFGYAGNTAGLPWLNLGLPSELGSSFLGTGQRQRMPLVGGRRIGIEAYGRNDINAPQTLAQVQATLITIWQNLTARGVSLYRTTMTPYTTSTDNWFTVANQTASNEPVRLTLNAWFRDGCPMIGTAPQATGATGATVTRCAVYNSAGAVATAASGPQHLLSGVLEIADLAESARNSGKWAAPERIVADAAITSAAFTVTSATAAFTSADVGKSIVVVGAGAAGAVLSTVITAYTNATTVTVLAAAGTTVSGASAAIAVMTGDGIHPLTSGHKILAPALPFASLV